MFYCGYLDIYGMNACTLKYIGLKSGEKPDDLNISLCPTISELYNWKSENADTSEYAFVIYILNDVDKLEVFWHFDFIFFDLNFVQVFLATSSQISCD